MIPKEIAFQIVRLKEKVKIYSSMQRSLDVQGRRNKVDEIKVVAEKVNTDIADLSFSVDNILVDGLISKFEIDNWFEGLKDKTIFHEPNPRGIYENEQNELERKRKEAEEIARLEIEDFQNELREERIRVFRSLCYDGPESYKQVQDLIENGLDVKQVGRIYDMSTLIERGRSSRFIKFLIESGMKVNEDEQIELEILIETEKEKAKRQIEESQKKLKERRNEEFKTIWYNGPGDIYKVQKLINDGFDITQANVGPSVRNLISRGRSMNFIKFLITAGLKITNQDSMSFS